MRSIISILAFLAAFAGWAQGTVSLEELRDSAVKRNADLQQLKLEIDRAEKQNLPYNGLGSTSVNYTYGQIDAPVNDYQWQITQPLGNPLAGLANSNLRKASVESSELNYELNRAWLNMQVYTAYAGWQGWNRIREIRSEMKDTYQNAIAIAERQQEEGEISKVEVGFARGRYFESVQNENQALQQVLQQVYLLEVLTQMELSESRPERLGQMPGLELTSDSANLYQEYYNSQLKVAEESKDRSNASLFPSFSVGYFNQRLVGNAGLQGVSVGAQIPLFDVSVYQQRQLARIDLEQRRTEVEQQIWQRKSRLKALEEQKNQILQQLQGVSVSPGETEDNLRIARKRYEVGETDLLELSQSLSALAAAEINQQQLLMVLHRLQAEIEYLNAK